MSSLLTIISGGQTGVDRAALDFAIEQNLPHGGWCPRGRLAEDGPLDEQYQLRETPGDNYAQRTAWNIRDSDATVVFSHRLAVTGGTALTLALAREFGKPCLHLIRQRNELETEEAALARCAATLRGFLRVGHLRKLNIAGPRASQDSTIGKFATAVLRSALEAHHEHLA